jgi:hypothetical protein
MEGVGAGAHADDGFLECVNDVVLFFNSVTQFHSDGLTFVLNKKFIELSNT